MATDVDPALLRRLTELDTRGAKVLSVYLDLDPTAFAAPRGRESLITSALDELRRRIDAAGLDHDARIAARDDVDRLRSLLETPGTFSDARALALFACGPADLLEAVRLPHPVATGVFIEDDVHLEPLTHEGGPTHVAVALVDRHHARLFAGTPEALEEVASDEASRSYKNKADDAEVNAHLKAVADDLLDLFKRRPFDVLLLGAREELRGAFREQLNDQIARRVAGEVTIDINTATPAGVRVTVAEALDRLREQRVNAELSRLREGLGRGEKAAAGLADVRDALEQRRVEVLLYERGRSLDGLDELVEAAVQQDADVIDVDAHDHPELGPHEGIGAVLRF
jgi:peptide chain release factor subunit 1